MGAPATSLFAYEITEAKINTSNAKLIEISTKYENNAKKLSKYQGYEDKWQTAYDKAYMPENDVKFAGAPGGVIKAGTQDAELAEEYAYYKVEQRNEKVLEELEELDVEYDSIKSSIEAELELLRAEKDGLKQAVTTNCQDTGILQG